MNIVKNSFKLSQPCEEVSSLEEGFDIIDTLSVSLKEHNGIGLAANQLGIQKRACIITPYELDDDGEPVFFQHNFINPVITKYEEPFIFKGEGCLSFPGDILETVRYKKIVVTDMLEPTGREFEGLAAVIAQHEIGHLNGEVMHSFKRKSIPLSEPCRCGSGKKFKKCCLVTLRKNGEI